jgi:hypothetical protein
MEKFDTPAHFQGKKALEHVAEAQAKGKISSAEIHGSDLPGHLYAMADAAKELSVVALLVAILFQRLNFDSILLIALFGLSYLFWKTGRSAFLGWSRLERMHRIVEQERWEIQHHRKQEREELKELYRAKGLEGKLLDDVMDVLMADEERLLRVMVDEELCLQIESQEHPLKQAAGAFMGGALSLFISLAVYFVNPFYLWFSSGAIIALATGLAAHYVGNKRIPAIVWNLGLFLLSTLSLYFLSNYLKGN